MGVRLGGDRVAAGRGAPNGFSMGECRNQMAVQTDKSRFKTLLWLSLFLSLRKSFNLSEPQFPQLEMEILLPS